jgi:hypothetical protein
VVLSDDELAMVARLDKKIRVARNGRRGKHWFRGLDLLERYYDGEQRLIQMGLAVPPELRQFETVVGIPAMAVDETERRQSLKSFQRSGNEADDKELREAWEFNNLDSQASLTHKDTRIYGRGFVAVSTNDEDAEHPLITPLSPKDVGVQIDQRHRRISAALKVFKRDSSDSERSAMLYLPDATVELVQRSGTWSEVDRDDHRLGAVPIVMFLNKPKTGEFHGHSEMNPVIGLTDSISRMVTNMQVAGEIAAIPQRWITGASKGDFIDKNGKQLPVWEAYFTAIKAISNKDAKLGQWSAADLANFTGAVNNMLSWCAAVLGLPTRYAGQQAVNPASEGAIIADEARLIKNVERMNSLDGDCWSWVMALYERFRTGAWPIQNSIRALWHDPATPTYSQRADAVLKLHSGNSPILSREGAWDELGWSEERKATERRYFEAERSDPDLQAFYEAVSGRGRTSGDGQ